MPRSLPCPLRRTTHTTKLTAYTDFRTLPFFSSAITPSASAIRRRYAQTLAKGLLLPEKEIDAVQKAAYLHDIGKIGLPDRVLHKKERLNDEEFEYIKRHQADGARILEGLPFYKEIVPYILYHHERYDGKGYPHGLSGDMIPRGAQIISIADAYDAMTTGRGYNNPLTAQEAIAELKKSLGQQFHPLYAETFIKLLEEKKIHAFDKA